MNSLSSSLFHRFSCDVSEIELPQKFTFPFFYQPHPLAIAASEQLQQWLSGDGGELHDFDNDGKMFGVLVVRDNQGELGFLTAYSGQTLKPESEPEYSALNDEFCPMISLGGDEQSAAEQLAINEMNSDIARKEANPLIEQLATQIKDAEQSFSEQISAWQTQMAVNRKARKAQRANADEDLVKTLAQQSVDDKNKLRDLKLEAQKTLAELQQQHSVLVDELNQLKQSRKQRSNDLQQYLFAKYQLLNAKGETRDMNELFATTAQRVPPSGSGDCAAPKLLQVAYQMQLTPIALSEFWWGRAPDSQVRQHKQVYPACIGKCQPILNYMLQGLEVDEDPLQQLGNDSADLDIVHEEESFLVINKPSGLLSVPGRHVQDSVKTRIRALYPNARGGLIVHRLDMATSGLMLIALNERAQKNFQHQFIKRIVHKQYVAIVDGMLDSKPGVEGEIELPLCNDFEDRPRQKVCAVEGKPAHTMWQITKQEHGRTWLNLWPVTGRTHQLRVHCAHHQGLNTAIVGDDLYGNSGERLMLHAQRIEFNHPLTKQPMVFEVKAPF
ncbi:pseudouridine synthase [Psychrobium sp. MM17-31]|uniref:RluA family pseudouridine synthase n=1 Tax=Psychrobium sp. MM17-31 TaxID=2917758 RepID=UPI001EF64918|nr:RluA family pseudouridine synthase [Psychrobium sp. MM17-31]MCG7529960.1 pseudouridine synthase [Psychrobium sp. MM17-31]